MLMIGFFEGIPSERQIVLRCEDSLSLRGFLGYALDEATPDHSSMTIIRQRLGSECFERVFALVVAALRKARLAQGPASGIDFRVIEANASLRSLSERNTEEAYWDYVQRLAKESGLERTDGAELRNFDRKRAGKKMSNEQWQNLHDPDAKIGRTKDGAADMVYLPEPTVDLDTGAIVQAQVLAGDHRDSEELSRRVIEAVANVQEAKADPAALPGDTVKFPRFRGQGRRSTFKKGLQTCPEHIVLISAMGAERRPLRRRRTAAAQPPLPMRRGRSAACNAKSNAFRRQREILKKAMSILSEESPSGLR